MDETAELGRSAEDYLEAVLVIGRRGRRVRVTDIAGHLAVAKSSVVSALAGLEGKGLVEHERYGEVQLTARGALVAEEMYRRHRLLQGFLRDVVGVPDDVAARDACRMEHELSPETISRMRSMMQARAPEDAGSAGKR